MAHIDNCAPSTPLQHSHGVNLLGRIAALFGFGTKTGRRKVQDMRRLPPHLAKDIGFETGYECSRSLNDKLTCELDTRSR
ncbi:hypothetical protein [Roseibium sp. RKSG952]|uniref:hypothetical protein n=1 Tax=Roseibium sp. RKSG952 TaxID=2529384 RepID=UPI0012BD25A9|nr:hypothetical protein [Roseibium sp. RKSG952]MTH98832.1 hypothetical protein [Roseibium sp. RKSG952]